MQFVDDLELSTNEGIYKTSCCEKEVQIFIS